ncbi:MAG TPA: hypothetical protein VMW08_01610 [Acidimicrobiales bacterium]|nr:hypothetical protein [Acidimicrobiales bacterium]
MPGSSAGILEAAYARRFSDDGKFGLVIMARFPIVVMVVVPLVWWF